MAGLYIHIPYCHAKCAYCDFYSMPCNGTIECYIKAIVEEARLRAGEINGKFRSIYIGGGTPSSIDTDYLGVLLKELGDIFDLGEVEEFTIEVNPEDVNPEFLSRIKNIGVNRVSMGVQSLVDGELKAVGRRHSSAEALAAARLISEHFKNYSLDIIYGLPQQTLKSLKYTVEQILLLRPPHLSAYLLSYEPGTRLYAMLMAGKVEEATEQLATGMYELVDRMLTGDGYVHYEISNFALPGKESMHNSSYWNSTPYLGLGVSAHSFDGVERRYNEARINDYINCISNRQSFYTIDEETDENRFNDYLITRLRTSKGLDLSHLTTMPFGRFINKIEPLIDKLIKSGSLVRESDQRLVIPSSQWLTSDAIMRELII